MRQQECKGCAKRDRIIKAQRREIERLRRIIERAVKMCASIAIDARDKMQAGNLPRAAWSYERRGYEVAKAVLTILKG